jgi:hypothetical protein
MKVSETRKAPSRWAPKDVEGGMLLRRKSNNKSSPLEDESSCQNVRGLAETENRNKDLRMRSLIEIDSQRYTAKIEDNVRTLRRYDSGIGGGCERNEARDTMIQ